MQNQKILPPTWLLISLVGMLFPAVSFIFMIGPILLGALGLVIYSYVRFTQIERNVS